MKKYIVSIDYTEEKDSKTMEVVTIDPDGVELQEMPKELKKWIALDYLQEILHKSE